KWANGYRTKACLRPLGYLQEDLEALELWLTHRRSDASIERQADLAELPAKDESRGGNAQIIKPRWDGETRKLWLGVKLLKSFDKNPARNQIDVIEAFDRENWALSVASPFKDKETQKQACKFLNRTLPRGTIRFGGDGSGEGLRWTPAEPMSD